jgi:dihydroneopterin aldolase/2-amino-4-hydroxy-6-hydroxymethyldihydropteridine diphosphokinase
VLTRPLVEAVEVVVHKPQAPVGHPFTDVQVRVRRERETPVVVALGSNVGDSLETLRDAAVALFGLIDLDAVSPVVETDPVGGPDQPPYLNAVVTGTTSLSPRALLRLLHDVEAAHGRTREVRWGPRTLDLDLVQYGDPAFNTDVQMDDAALTLPHPRAHERAFVLVPWLLADPEATLRVSGEVRRVTDLVAAMDTSGVRPGPEGDLLDDAW